MRNPAATLLVEGLDPHDLAALPAGDCSQPHRILGAHPVRCDGLNGTVIRAFHPHAVAARALLGEQASVELRPVGSAGLFAGIVERAAPSLEYDLEFRFADGAIWQRGDPYRFLPTLGDLDLHLFNEGTHRRLWRHLGAHPRRVDGVDGIAFAVWAPNARRVSVVGDFCNWDGRLFPMRQMGSSGVFELFVPGLKVDLMYKYEIRTRDGALRLKADPMVQFCELPPGNASRVFESRYHWADDDWMARRTGRDWRREPMNIYEVHLGSWRRVPEEGDRLLNYRELAPLLVEHMKRFGFTHLELLPVAEHPFPASWGYQVTGYYAPTARHGTPDDFRYLVDYCHRQDIGVILDWVPAHFPKDDFALRRFDGTALYEHDDPRRGEHPDWGTLVFNYGRNEVRNFLIANALFWLEEFHIDGLRVDAVASMLYLDYSRRADEWYPNPYGGKENIEAIEFLRAFNETIRESQPGCVTIAEESTAWTGVTRPVSEGGLGFTFKWNMGWMHDTLGYFATDPLFRKYHHNQITFAMLYEHTERFIMPLSHDEVVHGKGSLLARMPGDDWQKFANLRLLFAYQYTRPGKQLLFMGGELAQPGEWYYAASLDWHLAHDPARAGLARFLADLGKLYLAHPCLWYGDPDHDGFRWIHCDDHAHSVLSYVRACHCPVGSAPVGGDPAGSQPAGSTPAADDSLVCVLNLTPVPRHDYRIGAPAAGTYRLALCSDDPQYGGSGYPTPREMHTDPSPFHGYGQSLGLTLPPLAALVLARGS